MAYLGLAFFPLSFYVPDPDFSAFLIAPHLIQAVWIGMGMHAILRKKERFAGSRKKEGGSRKKGVNQHLPASFFLSSFFLSSFFLLPLFLLWTSLPRVDRSEQWGAYRLGQFILDQPLTPGALVLADSQKIAPLYYLQVAEGLRPDLDIRVLPDEAAYRAALDEGLAAGKTVYLGRYLPGLAGALHLRSVGPLVEAAPAPLLEPPPLTPLNARFGNQITLLGYNLSPLPVGEGPGVRSLTLHWRADSAPDGNYLVRLRLLGPDGETAWEAPPRLPAGGLNPTFAWSPGEIIPDFHFLSLPPTLPAGEYTLQVGLFPPFSQSGLPVAGGSEWQEIARLAIPPPAGQPAPPQAAAARFPDAGLTLAGYDLPQSAAPGSQVTVTLYWRASTVGGSPLAAPSPALELRPGPGGDGPPLLRAGLPAGLWSPGEVQARSYTFTAPPTPGDLPLWLSVSPGAARCGWLRPATDACPLPPLHLSGAAASPDAVNFDSQILLTAVRIETPRVSPGGLFRLSADWQGLRTMSADYTVFVHLLGPDGAVHGQVDTWPGQGARPTRQWVPGQALRDRYEFWVPTDAPPGPYRVEIGWYLLATGDRLPVLGPEGTAVDDRYLIPGLTVTP